MSLASKGQPRRKEPMKSQVSHAGRQAEPAERICAAVRSELELRRKRARNLVSSCPGCWEHALAA